ncbi:hypothetical protein MAM1_0775d11226 [Mucor ambiguus]|uniref:Uncharacterized protein n=1 Tax=Mucor ambiguus TaxID=91626 RepID=A0A0C9N6E6_9FUNG|nr:hypothetical protein MAM1_0775d11226 [Mucor ambiguus]
MDNKGKNRESSTASFTQYAAIDRAFAQAGVNSRKKTHAGREPGARNTEMSGASVDHIKRIGRWSLDIVEDVYATCLLRTALKIIDSFSEQQG